VAPSVVIRPARDVDLDRVWDVYYQNEIVGLADPPARPAAPRYLRHVLVTGDLLVAERDGEIAGYAGLIRRGDTAFLTDLFVLPDGQSGGVGRALLDRILPADRRRLFTVSSTDRRALALYVRAGMTPRWPHILLEAETTRIGELPCGGTEIVEAAPDDPDLAIWEAEIGGRPRPVDVAFWIDEEAATPLWFRRDGETIGYGFVRSAADSLWHPEGATLGPIGARQAADAAACVLATVAWARDRRPFIELAVPGPHPALVPLLNACFTIAYVETYCAADIGPIDPERYAGSGGNLF
jgi:GNAT superfamily N-acetyltransferase